MRTKMTLNGKPVRGLKSLRGLSDPFRTARVTNPEALQCLDAIGMLIAGEAKQLIQTPSPSNGPVVRYSAGGRKRIVYPAKRGFPPNTDTGMLVSSIHSDRRGMDIYIGSTVIYSKFLENPFVLNRQFLVPAAVNMQTKTDSLLTKFMMTVFGSTSSKTFAWKPGRVEYN